MKLNSVGFSTETTYHGLGLIKSMLCLIPDAAKVRGRRHIGEATHPPASGGDCQQPTRRWHDRHGERAPLCLSGIMPTTSSHKHRPT